MDSEDPPLKPIAASLLPLIASSNGSGALTHPSKPTDPIVAVERAKILAGCYRKDDAADPETYLMALSAVLAEYPPDIVGSVTDPRSGLPSRSQWLPTVKEVRDACEQIASQQRRIAEMKAQERAQLEARKQDAAKRFARPTLAELKAKYGENWGMKDDHRDEARNQARADLQKRANKTLYERECEANGFPADSPISPSLASLIKAGMA